MQNIEVPFGSRIKVSPVEGIFQINHAAISLSKPAEGRVVLYIAPINHGENIHEEVEGKAIAVAPLIAGKSETATLDLCVAPGTSIILSTKGSDIDVTVTGFCSSMASVVTEKLE